MSLLTNTQKTFSLSSEEYIDFALKFSRANGTSCAAWRSPEDGEIHLIIGFDGASSINKITLEELDKGFLFAPFDKTKDALHIRSDIHINISSQEINSSSSGKLDEFIEFLDTESSKTRDLELSNRIKESSNSDPSDFLQLVDASINAIKDGDFQKVVPSRFKAIKLENELNNGSFFSDLCKAYNNAFVSLVFDESCGLWLGATPELLLDVRDGVFNTVALASTQKYEGQPLTDVAWTQKEIEEQALVSRYIINCFKKIRLREFDENGPKAIKAGNLIHLRTQFTVDMESTNFPDLGTVMLELLHPTSAICGMPLESSLDFLLKNEHYDRKYFSGFLGPVQFQNSTALYVNLRCMKVDGDVATVYAGAGVTEDSKPEKEWLETEMKMNTLLNLLS